MSESSSREKSKMKIQIVNARAEGRHLVVVFGHDNWSATPEGIRAKRILMVHDPRYGYSGDRRSFTLYNAGGLAAFNSTAACQAEMDRLANVPITLTFSQLRVHATNSRDVLTDIGQVRACQAAGGQVVAQFKVTASLAVLSYDIDQLEKAPTYAAAYPVDNDPCSLNVVIYMIGDREKADPWQVARGVMDAVRRVIK